MYQLTYFSLRLRLSNCNIVFGRVVFFFSDAISVNRSLRTFDPNSTKPYFIFKEIEKNVSTSTYCILVI